MKKLFSLLALFAGLCFLGACSTAQQVSATQAAAKAQKILADGCLIVQPTLMSVQAIDPAIAPFVVANGAFCAGVGTVSVASIQSMVSTAIPAAEQLITSSTLIPEGNKPVIIGALTAFQVALSSAMLVLDQTAPAPVAVPTTPAATPGGASA